MEEIFKILTVKTSVIAVSITAFAVIISKYVEKYLRKDMEEFDETLSVRKVLREEVDTLHIEIRTVRGEVDSWRGKYWEQIAANSVLHASVLALQQKVNSLNSQLLDINTKYEVVMKHLNSLNCPLLPGEKCRTIVNPPIES